MVDQQGSEGPLPMARVRKDDFSPEEASVEHLDEWRRVVGPPEAGWSATVKGVHCRGQFALPAELRGDSVQKWLHSTIATEG